jgi:hypothetical protein
MEICSEEKSRTVPWPLDYPSRHSSCGWCVEISCFCLHKSIRTLLYPPWPPELPPPPPALCRERTKICWQSWRRQCEVLQKTTFMPVAPIGTVGITGTIGTIGTAVSWWAKLPGESISTAEFCFQRSFRRINRRTILWRERSFTLRGARTDAVCLTVLPLIWMRWPNYTALDLCYCYVCCLQWRSVRQYEAIQLQIHVLILYICFKIFTRT